MLTLSEEKIQDMVNEASQVDIVSQSKAVLKFRLYNGKQMEVVFKTSEREQGKFLFAVFRKESNRWVCIETGYHSNMNRIQHYLFNKYVKEKVEGDVN